MSHFYTPTGEACHFQPTKPGAKNKTRPSTIADAKRLGLYPSVNGIIEVMDKPALTRWKLNKVCECCFCFTPKAGETPEAYQERIMEQAFQSADDAADLGTRIHAGIEAHYTGQPVAADVAEYVRNAVAKVDSLGLQVIESEFRTVSHEHGYAGTSDLACRKAGKSLIVDFKSTKTKPGRPVEAYESHEMQIAAYHRSYYGVSLPLAGINVFISTTEPGRVEVVEHTEQRLELAFGAFLSLCHVYRFLNGYDCRNGPQIK